MKPRVIATETKINYEMEADFEKLFMDADESCEVL